MHPYFDLPRPHLFAHRGASGERPQNTIPAFERAIELGIPYLETDCQATWDGEIVLSHDETVDDQTDGSGPIRDYEFADLQRLDAGHGFTPDGGETFPFRGQGVRIPRLADRAGHFRDLEVGVDERATAVGYAADVVAYRLARVKAHDERVHTLLQVRVEFPARRGMHHAVQLAATGKDDCETGQKDTQKNHSHGR